MLPTNEIICGDCLEVMVDWPDSFIQCVVTSPPYWGLRDYGTATWDGGDAECDHQYQKGGRNPETAGKQLSNQGTIFSQYEHECKKCGARRIDQQLGLEKTPEEYVAKMVEVFREVRRVLRDDGTLWLNLGDSYASGEVGRHDRSTGYKGEYARFNDQGKRQYKKLNTGLKPKDLCGIPWRVALALQADGWYLRQDIIWSKPNPMPESCTDRCTKAHEYIFLLTKKPRYFYDQQAIAEPFADKRMGNPGGGGQYAQECNWVGNRTNPQSGLAKGEWNTNGCVSGKNKRSVWTVKPKAFPDAHFATFPPKLIEPCILAGTSKKGRCPECGGPWERVVEKDTPVEYAGKTGRWGTDTGRMQMADKFNTTAKTLGWRQTCKCMGGWDDIPIPFAPEPCIVFDPFMGSGTVAVVAAQLGRDYVGAELSPEYVAMAEKRLEAVDTGVPVKEADKGQMALFQGE